MPLTKLSGALQAVDWNSNVSVMLADIPSATTIAERNLRIAVWARQFEITDKGNPALCFVREMQIAGQHVAALIGLALYKPAASSMRAMFETALYYTYFRTHPSELQTLVRDAEFYIEKRALLEYHKLHTPRFTELQQKLGLVSRLERWYSEVSAVIHGQIPGAWIEHKSLSETVPIKNTQDVVLAAFIEGEDLLHRLFLCTSGRLLWDLFSTHAKKELLRGLPGDVKITLELDVA